MKEIPVLTPEYLTSVSVDTSPRSYLFTSATVRIAVHTNDDTELIRYVTHHFKGRRCAASFRYRNRTEIIILMREKKPYPVWFS